MIDIRNLAVSVDDKSILSDISLTFERGKNYCLLGKNGSGKSSLSSTLMGHPRYAITHGEILLDGEDLTKMSPEARSRAGMFLSFQHVTEIRGITLLEYLRTIYNIHLQQRQPDIQTLTPFVFRRFIKPLLTECHIDEAFLSRDLNVGFSGGEKRKLEMLQLRLIEPTYIILDEIDSGLDLDAFQAVATMLSSMSSSQNSIIIITHYFSILEHVQIDQVHVMHDGNIIRSGDLSLATAIQKDGFSSLIEQ